MSVATCRAAANIAVIKYWGKRDERLVLPLHDSLSCTLDFNFAGAKTTVYAGPEIETTRLWLNGEERQVSGRMAACIEAAKSAAVHSELVSYNLHVCSENNFPTAAGLASSAAGFACLAAALSHLYGIEDVERTSMVARLGSGSAARSVLGGFVQWKAGEKPDGSDSFAVQVAPSDRWPEMRMLILVVSDAAKTTSSTDGMRDSVATSELLKLRTEKCVPERTAAIKEAIARRDFETFAEITMKDSNQFHAICSDTYPPCVYMNDTSHSIVDAVHKYNRAVGRNAVAYTFDAGPNACLYTLEDEVPRILSLIYEFFPSDRQREPDYLKGVRVVEEPLSPRVRERLDLKPSPPNKLKYLIHSKVGEGPCIITDPEDHLVDEKGYPKTLNKR